MTNNFAENAALVRVRINRDGVTRYHEWAAEPAHQVEHVVTPRRAEQTESDFQGIGKIPTGLISALVSPLYFVTNKFNLEKMTSRMTQKLTLAMKNPEKAEQAKKFKKPLIASAAKRDIQRTAEAQKSKAEDSPPIGPTASAFRMLAPVSLVAGAHSGPSASPKNQQTTRDPEINTGSSQTKNRPTLYTIQVGAYKKEDSAKKLTRTLTEKGYKAFIAPTNKVKVPLYRVQVEQFNKRVEALELAKKLQDEENLKSFVTSFHLI